MSKFDTIFIKNHILNLVYRLFYPICLRGFLDFGPIKSNKKEFSLSLAELADTAKIAISA